MICFILFYFIYFLGLHLQHTGLGSNGSCSCQPTPQAQQHQILNPLSKAKAQICILMDTSWVLNPLSHNRNSRFAAASSFLFSFSFLATLLHVEFPGQRSDLRHSCNLSHSSNVRPLSHGARPGSESVSQHSQDATDPVAP